MSSDLHYAGLLEVSERIRRREVSAREVCQALLDRIHRLDGGLNSFLRVLPESALAEADQADREIAAGQWRGPLHGVPIGLKDLLFTKGLPTSAGMAVHRDFRPDYDATAVTRLRRAGAVIIGKLHMTEGATLDHHPDFPRPDNPWKAGRWTGVSSSGSGVAPAAGFCYGALGTDTGGSIRMPSAACGLSGIKPTWGRVSRHGLFPLAESFDHIGPLARSAADAAAILRAIAGADADDPTALPAPTPDYLATIGAGIEGVVVGVDWDFATTGCAPAMVEAFRAALATLEALGARTVPVTMPPAPVGEAMAAMTAEVVLAHQATFPARADDYGPSLRHMLEDGARIPGPHVAQGVLARERYRGEMARIFAQVDLIATPTLPRGAPTWDEVAALGDDMAALTAALMPYTVPFNLTGSPTLSVPCGFDPDGLPLSLQLIGRHLQEGLLCRAGHAYQQVTDFHTRRPNLD
ncbi:amidase [Phenylobacterium sp.]|uniref:amidase n=1 Tax=Phenylobacterium sp. TaxID=1871053 RepID=UPI0035B0C677